MLTIMATSTNGLAAALPPQTISRIVVSITVLGKDGDVIALVAGLILGTIGLAILSSKKEPKCPACKNTVKKGDSACASCGAWLEWK